MKIQDILLPLVSRQTLSISRQEHSFRADTHNYVINVRGPKNTYGDVSFVTGGNPRFHLTREEGYVQVHVDVGFIFRLSERNAKRLAAFLGIAFE